MPTIHVTGRDGEEKAVSVDSGISVMEAIRDNGFDELLALCGGCCSCATCHVHVAPEYMAIVGEPEEIEMDMLELNDDVDEYSRLGCQVQISEALDGITLKVAR